ncbi:unnamed protein product [Cylindrotheca closterium]|uniref:BspA family leucine-rich repeat surface protein n=1 Tax=Cylindrotheca closterium TaxID=2856 RepID=A0AAD2CGG6_9STRA|nr:unnamed protein product [Cylindrotheca closterium]
MLGWKMTGKRKIPDEYEYLSLIFRQKFEEFGFQKSSVLLILFDRDCSIMDSEERVTKGSRKSRSSGSRSSRRSSSNNTTTTPRKSTSPKRNEPRRTKKSKEELVAKETARSGRESFVAGAKLASTETPTIEGHHSGHSKHRTSKRRGQQDRLVKADAAAKAKSILERSSQPISGPMPGAHADSRGTQVDTDRATKNSASKAKDLMVNGLVPGAHETEKKTRKGRFTGPLGATDERRVERRARLEAEKGDHQNVDGLVTADAVESTDADQALEMKEDASGVDKKPKKDKSTDAGSFMMESSENNEARNDSSKARNWERFKQKKGAQTFCCLLFIFVVAIAAVGAWLGTSTTSSISKGPSQLEGDGITGTNVTDLKADTVPPAQDSETITSSPSGFSNSIIDFEPPSAEDCAAVASRATIQGQEAMPVQRYKLELDATPFLPMDLSVSADIIEEKFRELLALALTGCNRVVRNLRRLRYLEGSFVYAIGNVALDASGVEGTQCVDDSNLRCHRVNVALDIVVKDDSVNVVDVIGEVSTFLGDGVLAEKLELAGLYDTITVTNLGYIDSATPPNSNDVAPSVGPTPTPTPTLASPTQLRTSDPSASLVFDSTVEPTNPPTFVANPLTTPNPAPVPTPQQPTPSPTTFLNSQSSFRPTQIPQQMTSTTPTFVILTLTPEPSQMPSSGPSLFPSTVPSTVPSAIPTKIPTKAPTKAPTKFPSKSPTKLPSPNPSEAPTEVPSTSPSVEPSNPVMPCFQSNSDLSTAVAYLRAWKSGSGFSFFDPLFRARTRWEEIEAFYGPIENWCFSPDVTSMKELFRDSGSFNRDISNWDVSSVTDLSFMFRSATLFNQDISSWDVSSAITMEDMFSQAKAFNQDLSSWDVSSVKTMWGMFNHAYSFNQDLSSWDVSSVTIMRYMFRRATSFDQDLSSWDVSSVVNMYDMFYEAESFNQDLSSWDVSSVKEMNGMFLRASSFNQDLSSWDVSSATRINKMFYYASSFNQNLCLWGSRIPGNANVASMFSGATSCQSQSNPNLSANPPGPFCHVCNY